ncbi:MAG: DotU family type IV/VI secretion system protein, partial [Steroidobacteraceae bacterium]
MRPRPGRRPGAPAAPGPAAPTPSAAPAPSRGPPQGTERTSSGPELPSGALGAGVADFVSAGRNPILQAAVPLLVLAGRLRGQIANADVDNLQRQCVQAVRDFEDRCRRASVPDADVLAARYALCT